MQQQQQHIISDMWLSILATKNVSELTNVCFYRAGRQNLYSIDQLLSVIEYLTKKCTEIPSV